MRGSVDEGGSAALNKVDLVTSEYAVQAKFVRKGDLTAPRLTDDGLKQFAEQAEALGKKPAVVTNARVSEEVRKRLARHGIELFEQTVDMPRK